MAAKSPQYRKPVTKTALRLVRLVQHVQTNLGFLDTPDSGRERGKEGGIFNSEKQTLWGSGYFDENTNSICS